jgi:hypothetical protein
VIELSSRTVERVNAVFRPELREEAGRMLAEQCGDTLPFHEDADPVRCERVRFAVTKLSGGDLAELRRWIDDANVDWRNVLMDAGFGFDPEAHLDWKP